MSCRWRDIPMSLVRLFSSPQHWHMWQDMSHHRAYLSNEKRCRRNPPDTRDRRRWEDEKQKLSWNIHLHLTLRNSVSCEWAWNPKYKAARHFQFPQILFPLSLSFLVQPREGKARLHSITASLTSSAAEFSLLFFLLNITSFSAFI